MSQRSRELAAAIVRTQKRLRNYERSLARFVAEGKDNEPRQHSQHQRLLLEIEQTRNDLDVLDRSLRAESERPFNYLAFKVVGNA